MSTEPKASFQQSGYSIEQLLKIASDALFSLSNSAKLDAELLLCHQLNCQRSYLYTWPEKILTTDEVIGFRELFRRRQNGEPIAHIIGYREFWGLALKVTADTLIPRPDTEILIEQTLELAANLPAGEALKILDLGTGTGAIALALKSELATAQMTAIDFSPTALEVAKENAKTLDLEVNFLQSCWCQNLPAGEKFHFIVSNPPYIETQDPHLEQGDVRFEPITALTSGEDGLEDIRLIAAQAKRHLLPAGWLLLEHGFNQAQAVQQILHKQGFCQIQSRQDYAGNDRITFAQLCQT